MTTDVNLHLDASDGVNVKRYDSRDVGTFYAIKFGATATVFLPNQNTIYERGHDHGRRIASDLIEALQLYLRETAPVEVPEAAPSEVGTQLAADLVKIDSEAA